MDDGMDIDGLDEVDVRSVELVDLHPLDGDPDTFAQGAEGPVCVNCGSHAHAPTGGPGDLPPPRVPPTASSQHPAYEVPVGVYGTDKPVTRKDVGMAALGLLALGGVIAGLRWVLSR